MAVMGIDISHWQGSVDLNNAKSSGVKFVMLNAGYGRYDNQKDQRFEENYKKAKAAGLGVGAYWYSYAVNADQALEEAKCFCRAIKGKQFDYPVAFDIEDKTQTSLSATTIGDIITTFCGYMEKQGYYVQLYSYVSFLTNKVPASVRQKYDCWIANFDIAKPDYNGTYGMWQYTSSGKIPGITGKCDCDYAYKDYPTLIKSKGLNGYPKSTPVTKKALDTTGMKEGDKNLGVYELKSLLSCLEKAKYISTHISVDDGFGPGTTAVVNDLLKKWGYKENGIAGTHFVNQVRAIITSKL